MPAAVADERWYYNPGVIIVAGCIVAIISFGVRSSMGLFTRPISDFHQWDREVYGLAIEVIAALTLLGVLALIAIRLANLPSIAGRRSRPDTDLSPMPGAARRMN